jgi:hypothetical protein
VALYGTDGPKGEVGPTPSDLIDASWDYGSSDGEIFLVIKNGISPISSWSRGATDSATPRLGTSSTTFGVWLANERLPGFLRG